ncbi:hypothetical protein ROZALSC1DRAFT_27007 [Rozella allomycis CSF55]|uniref:Uncharacterized protein n=1 Tax=Rozella allomycis (strain CSF55) TaxID=988480 RepID=A0A075AQW2_ROZAC|nr:hypothetical protein O9G_003799 [Rozella allomycis CSF55]RKP21609.1 hypothetical protein ROZALSC1DRAFT_27007 [Rozella allomycis CSF55]|eukprot:EPZ32671.1 hypothetical protein O9G_003799 [Rozella allomycis CSF55]
MTKDFSIDHHYSDLISASPGGQKAAKIRKRLQFRFNARDDICLLRLVLESFPYNAPHGFKMMAWNEIANKLRTDFEMEVDGKRCKERTDLMFEQFMKGDRENLHRKSTEEEVMEKESLLQQLKLMMDELQVGKKRSGYVRKSEPTHSQDLHDQHLQELLGTASNDPTKDLQLEVEMKHAAQMNEAYMKEQMNFHAACMQGKPEDYLSQSMLMWKQEELRLEIQQLENLILMKKRHLTSLLQAISVKPQQ